MNRGAGGQDLLYRDARSLTLGGTLMLGVVILLLLGMSWRSVLRWEPLDRNLEEYGRLEQECRRLAERLAASGKTAAATPVGASAAAALPVPPASAPVEGAQSGVLLGSSAARPASPVATSAEGIRGGFPEACKALEGHSMRALGVALGEEVAVQHAMLQALKADNERELRVALAASVLIPLVAIAFWTMFNRRVLQPLGELGSAMGLLARKDYRTVDLTGIDPVIRPVFEKYNRMVVRIQDLEAAHLKREDRLRRELEGTVRSLLKQQAVLARADRLAALGDMTARMAHRLRSPLSGVLVTLTNLCDEPISPDQRERLRLSIEALERSFRELTALSAEAHQDPEPPTRLVLHEMVDEVLALTRHLSDGLQVAFDNRVPRAMVCMLPEAGTRHALMTLVNRAVEAQRMVDNRLVRVEAQWCDERVCIAVQDSGPGFAPSELAQGYRGPSVWNRRGAAMGLAVVGRLADHLGGELQLANLPEGGARATLIVPAQTQARRSARSPAACNLPVALKTPRGRQDG